MNVKEEIKSQYLAALEMLMQAVNQCPEDLWDDRGYKNTVWQIAYHALFYTHLYLQPNEKEATPWVKFKPGYHEMEKRDDPYSKADIAEYFEFCREQVDKQVEALDLEAPSGFYWLPFSKLELQLYSIRHLQQHTGELSERLGSARDIEVDWVDKVE